MPLSFQYLYYKTYSAECFYLFFSLFFLKKKTKKLFHRIFHTYRKSFQWKGCEFDAAPKEAKSKKEAKEDTEQKEEESKPAPKATVCHFHGEYQFHFFNSKFKIQNMQFAYFFSIQKINTN